MEYSIYRIVTLNSVEFSSIIKRREAMPKELNNSITLREVCTHMSRFLIDDLTLFPIKDDTSHEDLQKNNSLKLLL